MSKSTWDNNNIQFPRLIDELQAVGAITNTVMKDLCESMDLQPSQIDELLERAQLEWEIVKTNTDGEGYRSER